VEVLDHEHRRRPPVEIPDQRACDLVRARVTGDQRRELASRLLGYVGEWPKRLRREQRLAGTPQDPIPASMLVAKPSQESGLARPGLAAEQDQAADGVTDDALEGCLELAELSGSLEKVVDLGHVVILAPGARGV
jgi:hypothetical protein